MEATGTEALKVVSDPIYNKKAIFDLTILDLSHEKASCGGGQKIILVCEKVLRNDIKVRFFEETRNRVAWEAFGKFEPSQVYNRTSIVFESPRYKNADIAQPVKVKIQLQRESDGAVSEARDFEMLPLNEGDEDDVLVKLESTKVLFRLWRNVSQTKNVRR